MGKTKDKFGKKKLSRSKSGKESRSTAFSLFGNIWLWMFILVAGIYLIYRGVSGYEMINWDEKRYLQETPFILSITADNLKAMFTEKVLVSYNPLVLLSFAIDHKLAGDDWGWYHGVNVFFHLLNACLLYFFLRRLRLNMGVAELTSAFFAFHPMSVEAVAWIAGRKDVLYVFFYLLALISYVSYRKEQRLVYFLLSVFFALCSSLSKVQAVTLPLALLLTDYLLDKRFHWKHLRNKLPFFLIALATGIVAISGSSFVADKYSFQPTFMDKIVYSLMALGLYVMKWFVPVRLSVIHDFPEHFSADYWLLLAVGVIISLLFLFSLFRTFNKKILFSAGLLFFIIHIFPVLHIVAYNSAVIYERFTYLAGTGLILALCGIEELWPKWKDVRVKILTPLLVLFVLLTIQRIPVWKNPETLWTDAIEKNPKAEQAFNNRGQYYDSKGEYDKMLSDINASIALNPSKPDAWNNKTVYYFRRKEWAKAMEANEKVLAIDSNHTEGLLNRGGIYLNQQQFDSAMYFYKRLAKAAPQYAPAFYYLGACYLKKSEYRKAADHFLLAISKTPEYPQACALLAQAYARLHRPDSVLAYVRIADYQKPSLNARRDAGLEYIRMGNEAYQSGNSPAALDYYLTASTVDPYNAETFYDAGGVYLMMKDIPHARECWKKAVQLNPKHEQSLYWLKNTGGVE